MRRLHANRDSEYAAHTSGRNSFSAGIAVCGMREAQPADFGMFPLREEMVGALCEVAARLCAFYQIKIDAASLMTHAEAALQDGYFGTGTEERWDLARLAPSPAPLGAAEAIAAGDYLRERIRLA
jgi:hypothetical protein